MATIRTATDKVPATVGAIGKVKDGDYGPYQSVLFEGKGLPDGKVWRCMDPEQAQQFTRGQRVHLVPTTNKRGKPSWDIELLSTESAPVATAPTESKPQAQAIAQYIDQQTALYAACYRRASRAMDGAPDAAIQACASSAFIAAQRRFELA